MSTIDSLLQEVRWASLGAPHHCTPKCSASMNKAQRQAPPPAAALGAGAGGIHCVQVQPQVTREPTLGTQTSGAAPHRAVCTG